MAVGRSGRSSPSLRGTKMHLVIVSMPLVPADRRVRSSAVRRLLAASIDSSLIHSLDIEPLATFTADNSTY